MAESTAEVSSLSDDVALVRQTLMRELETINAYELFARRASSEEVRVFLAHLAAEEKEHVAEATALVRKLDAEQDRLFESEGGSEHYRSGTHTHAALEPAPAAPQPSEAPSASASPAPAGPLGGFSVGSQRARR